MNVDCNGCGKSYVIDPAKLAGRDRLRLKCAACGAVFEIEALASPGPPAEAAAAPVRAGGGGTATQMATPGEEPTGDTTRTMKEGNLLSDSGKVAHGALALPEGKKVSLAVLSGPDQGKMVPLPRPRMVIGRSDADIVLADPEASRQHAVIEVYGDVVVIRDLNSTNGTYVAESKITAQEVANHEEFRVGSSRMMVIVTTPDA